MGIADRRMEEELEEVHIGIAANSPPAVPTAWSPFRSAAPG